MYVNICVCVYVCIYRVIARVGLTLPPSFLPGVHQQCWSRVGLEQVIPLSGYPPNLAGEGGGGGGAGGGLPDAVLSGGGLSRVNIASTLTPPPLLGSSWVHRGLTPFPPPCSQACINNVGHEWAWNWHFLPPEFLDAHESDLIDLLLRTYAAHGKHIKIVYAYIYRSIYLYIYIYIYEDRYTYMYMYESDLIDLLLRTYAVHGEYLYMFTCIHVYIYKYIYMYVYIYI